jgi:hypothetical protein
MQSRSTVPSLALMLALLFCFVTVEARARQQSLGNNAPNATASADANGSAKAAAASSVEDRLKALEQVIERQQHEIQALHQLLEKRGAETANTHAAEAGRVEAAHVETRQPAVATDQTPASGKNEASPPDQTQKRVDER